MLSSRMSTTINGIRKFRPTTTLLPVFQQQNYQSLLLNPSLNYGKTTTLQQLLMKNTRLLSSSNSWIYGKNNNSPTQIFMRHLTIPSNTDNKDNKKTSLEQSREDSIDSTTTSLPPPQTMTSKERMKLLWKQYGVVFVVTYISVYLSTLGTIYELLAHDFISAKSAVDFFIWLGLDNHLDVTKLTSKTGNFALAWLLTKPTEPIRLVLSSVITPKLARMVGSAPPKVKKVKQNVVKQ
jgi:hypothetical protein